MQQFILVIHIIAAVILIGLVLLQPGKGADAASGLGGGGGSSQSIFGSQGSGSFLVKTTVIIAAFFFISSIALNYFTPKHNKITSLLTDQPGISKTLPATTPQK